MSEQISGQSAAHSDHDHQVDPVIVDAVRGVSNRFGVPGLEDLIAVATVELDRARAALEELGPEG